MEDLLVFDVASFYNVDLIIAAEMIAKLSPSWIDRARGDVERTAEAVTHG